MQHLLIDTSWKQTLEFEIQKEYFKKIALFLHTEREKNKTIYPKESEYFNALNLTPFDLAKVVIIGQDPYHNPLQAHGLAFSVPQSVPIPPSLKNIFKELNSDLGIPLPKHGNLTQWAQQGVLLLNTSLSVEAHKPNSHNKIGWVQFTDFIIKTLSGNRSNLVFMLWGQQAQNKSSLILNDKHLILKAPHPSPLSSYHGFFGCKHFSECNKFLIRNGISPINWNL